MTVAARSLAGMAPAEATRARRVPELDGIRAVAIWLVLAVHLALRGAGAVPPEQLSPLPRVGYLAVSHMWLGVDLFFVLSGFLITGILLDTKRRPTYWRDFYIRRALRILPLVAVVIAVGFVVVPSAAAWFGLSAFFLADFAAPLHVKAFPGAPPLWSLAVEEQFYLVWPFIVLALGRRQLAVAALAIVVLEAVLRFLQPQVPFEVGWLRWDGLAIGALAALWVRRSAPRNKDEGRLVGALVAIVVGLMIVELVVRNEAFSGAVRITEADLLFGAAIVAVYHWSGSWWTSPLRSRICRFAAETSFCVYLIHVPIIEIVDRLGVDTIASPLLAAIVRSAFVLPLAFGLAALSWRYFEGPILRLKQVFAS
jgi:peptidoglycan/LPS O-acetylase OafA/YrhL